MALRARRLASDEQMIRRCFGPDSRIRLIAAEGDPPERYRLEYVVNSLVVQNGEVTPTSRQVVEVYLTLSYPRQAPQCRMLTPVFHPNIAPHAVCIGDHWSAGESLAALLVRIAEMLTYQSYNLRSPLNGDAAKWADEHMSELPLEDFDFGSLLAGAHPAESASFMRAEPRTAAEPSTVPPPAPAGSSTVSVPDRPDSVVGAAGAPPGPGHSRTASCPSCGAALSLPENRPRHSWVRCPLCGRMLRT